MTDDQLRIPLDEPDDDEPDLGPAAESDAEPAELPPGHLTEFGF